MIGLQEGSIGWRLILASGSPRRRDLLREAGLSFQIQSPEVKEYGAGDFKPRELCLVNARLKCHEVARENADAMVIGADTVVALGGKVFRKPVDLEEAAESLQMAEDDFDLVKGKVKRLKRNFKKSKHALNFHRAQL